MSKSPIKLTSLAVDLQRETDGDWVAFPEWPGVRFKVRSVQSQDYKEAVLVIANRLGRQFRDKPAPVSVSMPLMGAALCDTILLGWEGFDIPYTPDAAREALTDPAYREVVEAVTWCAGKLSAVAPVRVDGSAA